MDFLSFAVGIPRGGVTVLKDCPISAIGIPSGGVAIFQGVSLLSSLLSFSPLSFLFSILASLSYVLSSLILFLFPPFFSFSSLFVVLAPSPCSLLLSHSLTVFVPKFYGRMKNIDLKRPSKN